MWLQGLSPQPSHQLANSLQAAPLLSPYLFGGLSSETVQKEKTKRKEDSMMSLIHKIKVPAQAKTQQKQDRQSHRSQGGQNKGNPKQQRG